MQRSGTYCPLRTQRAYDFGEFPSHIASRSRHPGRGFALISPSISASSAFVRVQIEVVQDGDARLYDARSRIERPTKCSRQAELEFVQNRNTSSHTGAPRACPEPRRRRAALVWPDRSAGVLRLRGRKGLCPAAQDARSAETLLTCPCGHLDTNRDAPKTSSSPLTTLKIAPVRSEDCTKAPPIPRWICSRKSVSQLASGPNGPHLGFLLRF